MKHERTKTEHAAMLLGIRDDARKAMVEQQAGFQKMADDMARQLSAFDVECSDEAVLGNMEEWLGLDTTGAEMSAAYVEPNDVPNDAPECPYCVSGPCPDHQPMDSPAAAELEIHPEELKPPYTVSAVPAPEEPAPEEPASEAPKVCAEHGPAWHTVSGCDACAWDAQTRREFGQEPQGLNVINAVSAYPEELMPTAAEPVYLVVGGAEIYVWTSASGELGVSIGGERRELSPKQACQLFELLSTAIRSQAAILRKLVLATPDAASTKRFSFDAFGGRFSGMVTDRQEALGSVAAALEGVAALGRNRGIGGSFIDPRRITFKEASDYMARTVRTNAIYGKPGSFIEPKVTWRGSVTDLVTDLRPLLTLAQQRQLGSLLGHALGLVYVRETPPGPPGSNEKGNPTEREIAANFDWATLSYGRIAGAILEKRSDVPPWLQPADMTDEELAERKRRVEDWLKGPINLEAIMDRAALGRHVYYRDSDSIITDDGMTARAPRVTYARGKNSFHVMVRRPDGSVVDPGGLDPSVFYEAPAIAFSRFVGKAKDVIAERYAAPYAAPYAPGDLLAERFREVVAAALRAESLSSSHSDADSTEKDPPMPQNPEATESETPRGPEEATDPSPDGASAESGAREGSGDGVTRDAAVEAFFDYDAGFFAGQVEGFRQAAFQLLSLEEAYRNLGEEKVADEINRHHARLLAVASEAANRQRVHHRDLDGEKRDVQTLSMKFMRSAAQVLLLLDRLTNPLHTLTFRRTALNQAMVTLVDSQDRSHGLVLTGLVGEGQTWTDAINGTARQLGAWRLRVDNVEGHAQVAAARRRGDERRMEELRSKRALMGLPICATMSSADMLLMRVMGTKDVRSAIPLLYEDIEQYLSLPNEASRLLSRVATSRFGEVDSTLMREIRSHFVPAAFASDGIGKEATDERPEGDPASSMTKPPLGVIPRAIWEEQSGGEHTEERILNLAEAIYRRRLYGRVLPREWVTELIERATTFERSYFVRYPEEAEPKAEAEVLSEEMARNPTPEERTSPVDVNVESTCGESPMPGLRVSTTATLSLTIENMAALANCPHCGSESLLKNADNVAHRYTCDGCGRLIA